MEYKEALKYDKRTYIQFYISLLKINNLIIFSFWPFQDYNSRIIKMFLFFFYFTVHLTINALFINEPAIHQIYKDNGSYNFIYQVPQILYSSIISGVINSLIKCLSLSQNNVIKLKRIKTKEILNEKRYALLDLLKKKFILCFITTFIILLFCWFYITCFCGIFVNTQIHHIKDSIISFSLSFIYPFFTCLIPGIFRIISLKNEKGSSELLYKLSSFIMLLI